MSITHSPYRISVVIPTLNNRSDYLMEAVKSVLDQTFTPSEIIVVNNGNQDITIEETVIPIKIVKTVYRAGSAQARNIGATFANCDYLAFLDDDDLWAKDYLEKIHEKIVAERSDCLIGRLDQLYNDNIQSYKNPIGKLKLDILLIRNPGCTGSNVTIKKESFLQISGYNPKLPTGQDKSIIIDLIHNGFHVIGVPEAQAIIREHAGARNTDVENLSEGILQFYNYYKKQMTLKQKAYNLHKVYEYRNKTQWAMSNVLNLFFLKTILDWTSFLEKAKFKFKIIYNRFYN